ncbi:DUF6531 domain-containing protein, partial [Pseudomonas indica]|uniref:DUF6531 domain-containing protein n=1 Tax=Pseudomonas indica TaxID=137658 RepID=UPI0023F7A727
MIRRISMVFLVLIPSLAMAETYYWMSGLGPLRDIKYPSYLSACLASIEASAVAFTPPASVKYQTSNVWSCNGVRLLTGASETVGYLYRYGDSCPAEKTYNKTTGECSLDQQKGPSNSCPSSFAGNPINFSIGNKFQSEADYTNNKKLSFIRAYNSLDGLWRHNYSTHLRFAESIYISLVMVNGRESFFSISGDVVAPISSDQGVLNKTSTGWQYTSVDNERFVFDAAGKLTGWSNANGAAYQLSYSGSQITVTDQLGNSLTFTEDADHQPLTLTAPGVQITYEYDAEKRLVSVNRTADGLTSQRRMHYEDPRNPKLLTGITDERGIRYATWTYDDQGRAISSEHANGAEKVTLSYNADGSTTVTNELGKQTVYRFQTIQGVRRIT